MRYPKSTPGTNLNCYIFCVIMLKGIHSVVERIHITAGGFFRGGYEGGLWLNFTPPPLYQGLGTSIATPYSLPFIFLQINNINVDDL